MATTPPRFSVVALPCLRPAVSSRALAALALLGEALAPVEVAGGWMSRLLPREERA